MEKKELKNGMFVELRDGKLGVIIDSTIVAKDGSYGSLCGYNRNLTNKFGSNELDIVKVYDIPYGKCFNRCYKEHLVWERPKEILDNVEKKYLSNFIRPFRDRIRNISKGYLSESEYIQIELNKPDRYVSMLPPFEPNTMYKGMKVDKEYTLEELGL